MAQDELLKEKDAAQRLPNKRLFPASRLLSPPHLRL